MLFSSHPRSVADRGIGSGFLGLGLTHEAPDATSGCSSKFLVDRVPGPLVTPANQAGAGCLNLCRGRDPQLGRSAGGCHPSAKEGMAS